MTLRPAFFERQDRTPRKLTFIELQYFLLRLLSLPGYQRAKEGNTYRRSRSAEAAYQVKKGCRYTL